MSTTRTFIDAGVLIAASKGSEPESEPALQLIEDKTRTLLTSVFVRLEAYPKAAFNPYPIQRAFLSEFFSDPDVEWVADVNTIVKLAVSEADRHGLSAMDALHVAAALLLGADEFITTEKPGKPIYRVNGLRVIHLRAIG